MRGWEIAGSPSFQEWFVDIGRVAAYARDNVWLSASVRSLSADNKPDRLELSPRRSRGDNLTWRVVIADNDRTLALSHTLSRLLHGYLVNT